MNEYDRIKAMSTDEIDRMGLLAEIHFDFDRFDIREADRPVLNKNADVLKKFDFLPVTVEGHCDERGTVEYNLALGERRAKAAYDYLVVAGRARGPDEDRVLRQGSPGLPGGQRGLLVPQPPGRASRSPERPARAPKRGVGRRFSRRAALGAPSQS